MLSFQLCSTKYIHVFQRKLSKHSYLQAIVYLCMVNYNVNIDVSAIEAKEL